MVSAMFLGVMEQLGIGSMGHYSQSPETLYYMAHALRWVNWEIGMLHDPTLFDAPMDLLLSKEKHKHDRRYASAERNRKSI